MKIKLFIALAIFVIIFIALAIFVITCCAEIPNNTIGTRSFKMGFTPWLYQATAEAQNITYSRILTHGDIIKHHLLGGIPWQEALDQTPYHSNVESEIQGRLSKTPGTIPVFLAIDSLDQSRSTLAPYRGATDNISLSGDWAARTWSSPEVIEAFINYSADMIHRFQPTHFEYGTEISELIINDMHAYADYLVFAEKVYTSLKKTFPDLKVMVSVAIKSPGTAEMQLIETHIPAVLAFSDVVGISIYPYVFFTHADRGDPANLPANWLSQVTRFSGNKPLVVSESGWIGEDLAIPFYSYSESSNEAKQNAYLQRLLQSANNMNMEFVIWWTVTDFDDLWTNLLGEDPVAKIWKDIGLYDQKQNPRLSLQTWDNWFNRKKSTN